MSAKVLVKESLGRKIPWESIKLTSLGVSCVATAEGKAIAPEAGVILHENRADPLPQRGQGLRDPCLAFLRLEGAWLLSGEKKLESHYKVCEASCKD